MIHFISFFWPYGVFASSPETYDSMGLGAKMALCVFPNVGLYLGTKGMLRQEESTFGIQVRRYMNDDLNKSSVGQRCRA